MVLSAAALLWIGRDQTIRGDNLEYATRIATQGVGHALLHTPANKYLIAVPLLVYPALFGIFGLDNYFPSRLLVIALVLISGGLFMRWSGSTWVTCWRSSRPSSCCSSVRAGRRC